MLSLVGYGCDVNPQMSAVKVGTVYEFLDRLDASLNAI